MKPTNANSLRRRHFLVTLRPATLPDAPAIAILHAESWRFAYRGSYPDSYLDGPVFEDRARVWNERLAAPAPNQHVTLAEDNGTLIGFACSYGDDDPEWGTLLDNLHVQPDRHRQGTGRLLLAEVASWSSQTYPGRGLYLWVLAQNDRAQRFYKALGASDQGTKTSTPPGGGAITAHRYTWSSAQLQSLQSPQ
jgi:ribosomal protein S18 acetylase RimI-like enzyme